MRSYAFKFGRRGAIDIYTSDGNKVARHEHAQVISGFDLETCQSLLGFLNLPLSYPGETLEDIRWRCSYEATPKPLIPLEQLQRSVWLGLCVSEFILLGAVFFSVLILSLGAGPRAFGVAVDISLSLGIYCLPFFALIAVPIHLVISIIGKARFQRALATATSILSLVIAAAIYPTLERCDDSSTARNEIERRLSDIERHTLVPIYSDSESGPAPLFCTLEFAFVRNRHRVFVSVLHDDIHGPKLYFSE